MKISLNGLNDLVATFFATEDVKESDLVTISDEMTVDVASADDIFTGVCLGVRDGIATVKLAGYSELAYTGTAPALGSTFLKAAADGSVSVATAGLGRIAVVVGIDTTEEIVKFILF